MHVLLYLSYFKSTARLCQCTEQFVILCDLSNLCDSQMKLCKISSLLSETKRFAFTTSLLTTCVSRVNFCLFLNHYINPYTFLQDCYIEGRQFGSVHYYHSGCKTKTVSTLILRC